MNPATTCFLGSYSEKKSASDVSFYGLAAIISSQSGPSIMHFLNQRSSEPHGWHCSAICPNQKHRPGQKSQTANTGCRRGALRCCVRQPQRKGQTTPVRNGIPGRPELFGANQANKLFGGNQNWSEKSGGLEKKAPVLSATEALPRSKTLGKGSTGRCRPVIDNSHP